MENLNTTMGIKDVLKDSHIKAKVGKIVYLKEGVSFKNPDVIIDEEFSASYIIDENTLPNEKEVSLEYAIEVKA